MGYKKQKTKENKEKKKDRKPIQRVGHGCEWKGTATHKFLLGGVGLKKGFGDCEFFLAVDFVDQRDKKKSH
jgi:hypothetical protein